MKYAGPFRDCQAWKEDNLELSTTSDEAAKFLDAAMHQLIGWYENEQFNGLQGTCKKMLEADENFAMGKIFLNGIKLVGTGDSVKKDPGFAKDLENLCNEELVQKYCNEREAMHVHALKLFSDGKWQQAANVWEQILIDYPKDTVALKFAYDTYFYLGEQSQIRDCVARVLPHFKSHDRIYGYLKGMLSFGQEENNYFRDAEKSAKEALQINQHDAWATHTLAHVFEMEGRFDEGMAYLSKYESDWKPCNLLACHIYWHWAVYAIDKGDDHEVLRLFDDEVSKRCKSGSTMLDVVDCVSLLYRMKLEGIDTEGRWQNAIEVCTPHMDDQIMVFNDTHICMALAPKEKNLLGSHVQKMSQAIKNSSSTYSKTGQIGTTICNAIEQYELGEFGEVVELLFPIKHKIVEIGGSNAQRDIFNQILIRACLQSESSHHQRLAKNLLYERLCLRPSSPLTQRLMARIL